MEAIQIPLLQNMHGHLRQGPLLGLFVPMAAKFCRHYVAMGNTKPPILTAENAGTYQREINVHIPERYAETFTALPAIKVREDTAPEMVLEALQAGHKLFKFYPLAKTTNADDGIVNYFCRNLCACYELIAEHNGYALFHPEHPGRRWDDTECEYAFFGIFEAIYNLVPKLNMVWEHLTDTRVLPFLLDMEPRVACTATIHHLMLRLNDVLGQNHHLCRPPAKMLRDVEVLRDYVTRGRSDRIMLGLDDAPHSLGNKECPRAFCGVWTTPVAPQLIVQVFEEEERVLIGQESAGVKALEQFVARNAERYYGLPPSYPPDISKTRLVLHRTPFLVPKAYRLENTCGYTTIVPIRDNPAPTDFVPFMAGQTLPWSVVGR